MSVEAALQELWSRLHELREALLGLRLTAVEDRPDEGRTALTDRLADESEELAAALEEAIHAVAGALESQDDVDRVRAGVGVAHREIGRAAQRFWLSLGDGRRQLELVRLARRGGQPWRDWVRSVFAAAEPCASALHAADGAVRSAWDELVERAATAPIRVEANAIGQQVTFQSQEERARLG
jgi:hypothetical protein